MLGAAPSVSSSVSACFEAGLRQDGNGKETAIAPQAQHHNKE